MLAQRPLPLLNFFPELSSLKHFHRSAVAACLIKDLLLGEKLLSKLEAMPVESHRNIAATIKDWRREYKNKEEPFLLEENLPSKNPFEVFDAWFKNVAAADKNASFEEAINNRPKSRMVLMKEYDKDGFCFYTHYNSAKGLEIDANPYGCMLFYWPFVDRQVRIEGKLVKLPVEAAETYWYQRPLKSRIGSKLSEQSKTVPNRKYLDDKKRELEKLAADKGEKAITRPDDWGGYRLCPDYFEFWQGQSDRIHDRIVFQKVENSWSMRRLSP